MSVIKTPKSNFFVAKLALLVTMGLIFVISSLPLSIADVGPIHSGISAIRSVTVSPVIIDRIHDIRLSGKKIAYLLVDENDKGFKNEADLWQTALTNAEYTIKRINAEHAISDINSDILSRDLRNGDKVLFIIEGHGGGTGDSHGIFTDNSDWESHFFVIGKDTADWVTTEQVGDLAETVRSLGATVVVIDNSCEGGATVKHIEHILPNDSKVCAIATSGPLSPSLVGYPSFGQYAINNQELNFKQLADWGSTVLMAAAHGNNFDGNLRVHQKGWMNGLTASMQVREGMGSALSGPSSWWDWNRKREMHVLLNPERYADKNPDVVSDPNYAPEADESAAVNGYNNYTLGWISDFQTAHNQFYATYSSTALNLTAYSTKVSSFLSSIENLKSAFLNLENTIKPIKILDNGLAAQLRSILKHPSCRPLIKPIYEIPRYRIRFPELYRSLPKNIYDVIGAPSVVIENRLYQNAPEPPYHISPTITTVNPNPIITRIPDVTPDVTSIIRRGDIITSTASGILLPIGGVIRAIHAVEFVRMQKYNKIACSDPTALIPEVLKDYPALKIKFDAFKSAEKEAGKKLIEASMALLTKEPIANSTISGTTANGCQAIKLK